MLSLSQRSDIGLGYLGAETEGIKQRIVQYFSVCEYGIHSWKIRQIKCFAGLTFLDLNVSTYSTLTSCAKRQTERFRKTVLFWYESVCLSVIKGNIFFFKLKSSNLRINGHGNL